MKSRLASPRFRRRLGWSTFLVAAVGTLAFVGVRYSNTGHSHATPIDYTQKAWVYRGPTHVNLTRRDRVELFDTATRFVRTAVRRERLDTAWDMLGPEMRAGQTRKSWDTGFNNVVPFKADGIEAWDILYEYKDDVAIDLSLVANHRSANSWAGKTFTLELKRYPGHGHQWLVASWVPRGVGGGGTLSSTRHVGPPPPPFRSPISPKLLFVPALFLVGLILLLSIWGVGGAVRSRRAARRYAEALGYKSSSNPS
jgi:hypothetical protein